MYERYEKLLSEKGITSYQVSKATGVSQQILSFWKKNRSKPSYRNLKKIADYLNVDIDYLIGDSSKRVVKPEIKNKCHYMHVYHVVQVVLWMKIS